MTVKEEKEEMEMTKAIVNAGDHPIDRSFPVITENSILVQHVPNRVLYGDTDSAFLDLSDRFPRESSKETVIAFADDVASRVNNAFPAFMLNVFNVTPERSMLVQTERELVSDKSYFIVKKNYILHYINKGGIDISGEKIMGLAVKRSDTPKIVKDFLNKMLDMLMDQRPFDEIKAAIFEFKADYHSATFLDIGRPMTIKNLAKYQQKYEMTGEMKAFPYHARASLFYNMMAGQNDVKIRSGDKIKVAYIDHPNIKYIAIPADAPMLPEFLGTLKIDWKEQWNRTLAKINIYLLPLGLYFDEDA